MRGASRESRLNTAFVMLADTLTADYDVVDLLHSLVTECTEIVGVRAGGLMLADVAGELQLVASTSESAKPRRAHAARRWGRGRAWNASAPGRWCRSPTSPPTARSGRRSRDAALHEGFLSVHAVPLRLRGETIGTMNLFGTETGKLTARDASAAQALADVATIGILQERVASQAHVVTEQLQRALDSRVVIEQAKGAVSQANGMNMDESFAMLRQYGPRSQHDASCHLRAHRRPGRRPPGPRRLGRGSRQSTKLTSTSGLSAIHTAAS